MIRRHLGIIGVIVLAILVAPILAADATAIWRGEVRIPTGRVVPFVARLKQSGKQVTGTLDGIGGPDVTISNGKIEGDTVTFNGVRQINGADVKFNYTAKFVDDNTLEFTIEQADGKAAPLKSVTKRSAQ